MVFTIAATRSPFEWDDGNRRHVREAGVEPYEAEEVVLDLHRIGTSAYGVESERRWALLGATEEGRVLFVVFLAAQRANPDHHCPRCRAGGKAAVSSEG
jgi:uncharacterized DUF497 family protein